jgi:ABC-type uncharacterized transport system permease subunit
MRLRINFETSIFRLTILINLRYMAYLFFVLICYSLYVLQKYRLDVRLRADSLGVGTDHNAGIVCANVKKDLGLCSAAGHVTAASLTGKIFAFDSSSVL